MENTSEKRENKSFYKTSKHMSVGLLAHVDAGKTTLAESILYLTGSIRKPGRCLLYTSGGICAHAAYDYCSHYFWGRRITWISEDL